MAYTTIDNSELYFQIKLYSGTGSTLSITFDGEEDMQPDLIWGKGRSLAGYNHGVVDSVRGVEKNIYTNLGEAEEAYSTGVTAFGSNGFTVGSGNVFNNGSQTYVAWCWKESADAGFDIVGYTGNGTDDTDISHNLSAVPHTIILKNRSNTNNENWAVYHHKNTAAPETDYFYLNTNSATADNDEFWSDEAPTSSVFTLGRQAVVNGSSDTHVAYLWSEKQGYSKFGHFVSNGAVDGNFVWTGFRPALVIIKRNAARDWVMHDNKRDGYNGSNENLHPNTNDEEGSGQNFIDLLSNGFKIRSDDGTVASGGDDMIYMAWAEAPFVNSNGVPCNAR